METEEAEEAGEEVEGAEMGGIGMEGGTKCRRPRSRGRLIGGGYRGYASVVCSTAVTESERERERERERREGAGWAQWL